MIRPKNFLILMSCVVIILSSQCVLCDNEGFFMITGSNLIKYHKPYHVSVVYQGYQVEKTLELAVTNTKPKIDDVS